MVGEWVTSLFERFLTSLKLYQTKPNLLTVNPKKFLEKPLMILEISAILSINKIG